MYELNSQLLFKWFSRFEVLNFLKCFHAKLNQIRTHDLSVIKQEFQPLHRDEDTWI